MRVLQVGLGGFGRNWASSVVPTVPEVELVGYVDSAPEALAALVEAGTTDPASCYSSVDEGISATSPDAVLVTANLPGHAPIARAALTAGLHVLVEKPFAPSVREAEELVELAADKQLVLMVSQNYRHFPAVRAVQAIVRDGSLGNLLGIDIDFRRQGGRRRSRPGRPLLTDPLLGDMSIHHFDLMRAVTDREPVEIVCRAWQPDGYGFGGPPSAAALVSLTGGLVVSYRGTWVSAGPTTAWAGEWRMEFDAGAVLWTSRGDRADGGSDDAVRIRDRDGEERVVPLPSVPRTDRSGTLTEFARAVAEGRDPETSGRDNVNSLAMTYAAIEAARTGAIIKLA